jgi:ABC-2 type transport system ATP-binding protein
LSASSALREPDARTIRSLGLDPRAAQDEVHEIVGVQLQDSAFPARLSVAEILGMYRSLTEVPSCSRT